ncbi:hypothetical protein D9M71_353310 [compost metagenome]
MQRCFLAGLDHHGATGRQRRCQLADHLVQRVVPRVDEGAHANGLAVHQRVADFAHLIHQPGQFGVLLQPGNGALDLHRLAPLHRHAQLVSDYRGHFRRPAFQLCGQRRYIPGTHAGRRARPAIEGLPRRHHRSFDIGLGAQRHAADGLLSGRVDHLGQALPARYLPGAVDVQPRILTHGPAPASVRRHSGRCAGKRRSRPRRPAPGPGEYARQRWGQRLRRRAPTRHGGPAGGWRKPGR